MSEISLSSVSSEQPRSTLRMHPRKFAMWLFIVSIIMLFGALTSAYIVRQAEGNWYVFDLPDLFFYSTIVILASSLSMHWAYIMAQKDDFGKLKIAVVITFILGIAFLGMQWMAWVELVNVNVYFVGNPSGSFVYVISGLHAVHIISALIVLLVLFYSVFRLKVHSKNMLRIELCATYWHFLDVLWVYLFVFLLLNR